MDDIVAASASDNDLRVIMGHIQGHLAEEKAYELFIPVDPLLKPSNICFQQVPNTLVRDARSHGAKKFSLEQCGFEFIKHDFNDGLNVEAMEGANMDQHLKTYLKSIEAFMVNKMEAKTVILYDWRIRSTTSKLGTLRPADKRIQLPIAQMAHADESARGGLGVLFDHTTEDEQELLKSGKARFRIMNIWRPLVPVVNEYPLALCEWDSVDSTDWELCDQVHVDRIDEAMYLKPTQSHRWWYLSKQCNNELSLFVVWDSVKFAEGVQASTPHVAFDIPGSSKTHERKSLEVRTIVITDD
ncbi:hypothetical protein F4805DRAFT_441724 [Annulohypoxylon moriforme]|nr:hypothetical protein F4805DRAFT_441724 [Annulohypoxylon moriforme]